MSPPLRRHPRQRRARSRPRLPRRRQTARRRRPPRHPRCRRRARWEAPPRAARRAGPLAAAAPTLPPTGGPVRHPLLPTPAPHPPPGLGPAPTLHLQLARRALLEENRPCWNDCPRQPQRCSLRPAAALRADQQLLASLSGSRCGAGAAASQHTAGFLRWRSAAASPSARTREPRSSSATSPLPPAALQSSALRWG